MIDILIGYVLGIGFTISLLLNLYLFSAARAHKGTGQGFAKRAVEAENKIEALAKMVQAAQQTYVINFKDDQVLKLASMVVDAVHTLEESKSATKN
jgi:hypothetical protein